MLSKKHLTLNDPREQKPFWQLSQFDDFTINAIAKLFVHERPKAAITCQKLTIETLEQGVKYAQS